MHQALVTHFLSVENLTRILDILPVRMKTEEALGMPLHSMPQQPMRNYPDDPRLDNRCRFAVHTPRCIAWDTSFELG